MTALAELFKDGAKCILVDHESLAYELLWCGMTLFFYQEKIIKFQKQVYKIIHSVLTPNSVQTVLHYFVQCLFQVLNVVS